MPTVVEKEEEAIGMDVKVDKTLKTRDSGGNKHGRKIGKFWDCKIQLHMNHYC